MKKKIKIAFSDFWGGFNYDPTKSNIGDNGLFEMMSEKFDIEMDQSNPDYLIYSVFGTNHLSYKCKKIFYTGENIRPDFNQCDYALTFDYMDNPKNFRFPLSAINLYEGGIRDSFRKDIDFVQIKKEKTRFCNFIFSNTAPNSPRNELFAKISAYKKVDAGGRVLNNIGYLVGDKLEFVNTCKFTICFENSESPGYTTEKLIHPKLVNSIPIYWGNPDVGKDWNTKAFVNAYDFSDLDAIVEFVKQLDNDDDLYQQMLMEPHCNTRELAHDLNYKNMLDYLDKIFL